MANNSKLKRLEKTIKPPKDPEVSAKGQNFYCCCCGTAYSRQKGYFPANHSPLYRGIGYIPVCNDCIDRLYSNYLHAFGNNKRAMRRMCMKLDLYWSESLFNTVEKTAGMKSLVRAYISRTNMTQYIDKDYDATILEEAKAGIIPTFLADSDNGNKSEGQTDSEIDPKLIEFWGRGYDAEFYEDLDKRYKKWTDGLGELTTVQESLYKQVCLNEVIIARSSAKGEVADKATKNLMDALSGLNIKPSQTKNEGQDAELEKMPLGVGIQTWEFSRPLPATPDNLKDKNQVVKEITTWFLGHACKMVGLKNSYCKMYEDAMSELRVKRPEFADEDDDALLTDIFGDQHSGGDG